MTITRATALLLLAVAAPAFAKTVSSIESPDHALRVELDVDDGRIGYRVFRNGTPLIATSRLGFLLQDAEQIQRNLAYTSSRTRRVDDTWDQPWGERRHTRSHYNELTTRFTENGNARVGRAIDVTFRVFDDGIGFRYEFPDQPTLKDVRIREELTEFDIARPGTAWWIPGGEWNSYEQLYNRTPITEIGTAHTPITFRTDDGTYLSIHEAALVDYSSMWLRRVEHQRLKTELAPGAEGWKVRRTAPFATPWRTLTISDRAGGLIESSLILNLNEPNALGDVSWFKPAKYVGVWWSLHLDTQSWATGAKHGATTENTRRYIDFAAANGFRGVLVEGWNPGWDGQWFANGWNFDFTRATPDFDIDALATYAKSKGVRLIGHHETGCAVSHYERQLPAAFDLDARLGIDVVKTGYVCDDGDIERQDAVDGPIMREWHDGQWQVNHLLRVVQEAAKRHVAIDSHESVKDTGLRRTYPNWVSREAARGMEYNAWGNPPNPPEHEANLVFTRMLSGPMDFTPGVLSLKGRGGQPIQSTLAKQLANYVVLYSPIVMAADLPEYYAEHMDAFQFIKDVPTDWEDTRAINGEPGDFVTIARKQRNGDDWYVGSVTDENARTLTLPLDFLDARRTYEARIYRDGDGADWKTNPFAFAVETRRVTRGDVLTLKLAPGGGEAIRLRALE